MPLDPVEQAAQAWRSLAAGAQAVHAHVRDRPFGVSTGAWIVPDPAGRIAAIAAWTVCPDFASVNLGEEGALEVARVILDKGIGLEAGLASEADAAGSTPGSGWRTCWSCRTASQAPDNAAIVAIAVAIIRALAPGV